MRPRASSIIPSIPDLRWGLPACGRRAALRLRPGSIQKALVVRGRRHFPAGRRDVQGAAARGFVFRLSGLPSCRIAVPVATTGLVHHAYGQAVAHRGFDLATRDADVAKHTIVEPLELAYSATQALLRGQAARPARAAQDEDAQPLRKRAHGAADAGLDDEVALDASLLLAFEEREQRGAMVGLGHSSPPARPNAQIRSLGRKWVKIKAARRDGSPPQRAAHGGMSSRGRSERLEGTLGIFWRFPN